ncbi:hypothetical protein Aperf_G00000020067 [Anoplocephala perfoliata]
MNPKLLADEYPYCAATLIGSRYLLTAATCVSEFLCQLSPEMVEKNWVPIFNFTTFQYLVRFGESLFSNIVDPLNADNMVKEIMFYPSESDQTFSDIAILKLVDPVLFTPSVSPISIPRKGRKLKAGTKCFAVGWKSDEASATTNALSMAEITILSEKRCEESEIFDGAVNICGTSGNRRCDADLRYSSSKETPYLLLYSDAHAQPIVHSSITMKTTRHANLAANQAPVSVVTMVLPTWIKQTPRVFVRL